MSLILGAQSAVATGYSIDYSCRMTRSSSTSFGRTITSDGNLRKWTVNLWIKRGTVTASESMIFGLFNKKSDGSRVANCAEFNAANKCYFYSYDGTGEYYTTTNAIYRDPGAWYNFHFIWDSDNVTAGDRQRTFVNGVEITSFLSDVQPPVNEDSMLFAGTQCSPLGICYHVHNNSQYFDGYIAQVIACDGEVYLPTKFGEFDEDSPTIWKPIDPAEQSLTFGTHGFWLDFADSSDLGNDVSGEGNDFTPSNLAAVDQGTDSPTNNFPVMNNLNNYYQNATYSEGNLAVTYGGASRYSGVAATVGLTAGKWYWEVDLTTMPYDSLLFGIASRYVDSATGDSILGTPATEWAYYGDDGKLRNDGAYTTYGDAFTEGDILSCALDIDNLKLYFAKNGTWQNSGVPTSGATGTGAISITDPSLTQLGEYFPAGAFYSSGAATNSWNFGSPIVTISSGNADGNGYGNFEYAVPSGYLAICTKNLGSDGG